MSEDIFSIRLLCVSASPPELDIWRQGVIEAPVPVDFLTADPTAGAAHLMRGGVDVCVLDAALPSGELGRLLKAARARQPSPFVATCAPHGSARIDGVDGMLPKPANLVEARALVALCVRIKLPTRVLIVDDSGTMRSIVRKILSASRFTLDIHDASEGIAALEQLRSGNFGMVFLDYNMPGLDGFETLSEIKREKPATAVVMMTSTLDVAIADRAQAAGALAFLKKPFYPTDIDAVLQRYYGLAPALA
jgi:DNA-binding NtrC family response regulator